MKKRISGTRLIALGFLIIILTGGFLLSLPVSSKTGEATPLLSAMFTATSATCVTGLVVFDTFTHWSLFGQTVLIVLIQIGGIGFMTFITMLSIFLKKRISLHERIILMQSAGTIRMSGIVKLVKSIFLGTFVFELCGALLLSFSFIPEFGVKTGIYYSVFHSVSAFCNAGFDLMGRFAQFSSLTYFADNHMVNWVIISLITIGGLGFIVWKDIARNGIHFSRYELHSKIVLITSLCLTVVPAVIMFFTESSFSMEGMTVGERITTSFFHSVTPRTAGFNTVDINTLSPGGYMLTLILMFIGGSPGSTAGGIKTTTFAVMILSAIAASRKNNSITVFKRRLQDGVLRQASAVVTIYAVVIFFGIFALTMLDSVPIKSAVFEVVSAMGTVGISSGIIPELSAASRLILMLLMYGGRVGGLTLMLVLAEKTVSAPIDRPKENILIG